MQAYNTRVLASLASGELHPKVERVLAFEQFEQRTPEWYAARQTLITASDCAAALGVKPFKTYKGDIRAELLQKKLQAHFMTNVFVEHGVFYEDQARDAAMKVLNKKCLDFGLVRHPTLPWLGASPDGITTDGIMIEVKCPLRRKIIPGDVPHHYIAQCQVQLEVCDIDRLAFVQYMPSSLTGGEPYMDITWVDRDRGWFESVRPVLEEFFNTFMEAKKTYVPKPLPAPPQCFIRSDLYDAPPVRVAPV